MSSAEINKTVARDFYAQGATGDRDDELIAEEIVYHGPPMLGEIRGREGFKQVLGVFRAAFPGFETTIEDLVTDGDRVAVRHVHHATQTGEFAGVPATGKRVTVPGIEILRIRDGQIVEFWHHDDFLALMQQLGAVPSPHSAGS
jgi:steroid delta-isomerase-like uncharacterized protein